jgi:hypothetical protein
VIEALNIARQILALAPLVRPPVLAIIKALKDNDDEAARKAFEAALRLAFVARQKARDVL